MKRKPARLLEEIAKKVTVWEKIASWESIRMFISKFSSHRRSIKLNFSATVLTLGLKTKIFENLRLCWAQFLRKLRTRLTAVRASTCSVHQNTKHQRSNNKMRKENKDGFKKRRFRFKFDKFRLKISKYANHSTVPNINLVKFDLPLEALKPFHWICQYFLSTVHVTHCVLSFLVETFMSFLYYFTLYTLKCTASHGSVWSIASSKRRATAVPHSNESVISI